MAYGSVGGNREIKMLYRKVTIWPGQEKGKTWVSYSAENGRDLSMGQERNADLPKIIAWAKAHRLEIEDRRS